MLEDISQQQAEINRRIAEAYDRLEALQDDDSDVSGELKALNEKRFRFAILSEVSDQLQKLEKLGGAELFWGENYDHDKVAREQKRVRDLVINYDSHVARLQDRLRGHNEAAEILEAKINLLNDESLSLQEQQAELMEEFVIEREMTEQPFRPMNLPWNKNGEDQRQFRKVLLLVLFFSMLLGVLIPLWDIPLPDRIEVVEIPERMAQLMVPKQTPPPAPPQEKPEEKKPEPEKPKKDEPVAEKPKVARKKAEASGLMAFKDDFADLIDDKADAKLGAQAKISAKGSESKKISRSLVTSNVGSRSSGINTASLSRNVGGSGDSIGGVEFARVESSIGSDFFGEERPLSGGPGPSRTDEEIQIVFDRYKAALYRIYNLELRKNPLLQGKMVLRLSIEPDGKVSACTVDSSDMDSPELDKAIADRVQRFNFGAKDGVPTITILYPIDFLPAS